MGYFAPAKTLAAIVKKLNGAVNEALGMADVKARLDALGLEPQSLSFREFSDYVRSEVAKWAKIIKTTGITTE